MIKNCHRASRPARSTAGSGFFSGRNQVRGLLAIIVCSSLVVSPLVVAGEESGGTKPSQGNKSGQVEQLVVKVLAVYPHDPTAFTQGLVWDGGLLYESTGLYGRSSLRRVDPMTGEAEWGMRCYEDDLDSSSWCEENIYDVYSLSTGTGLNGIPYSEW